MTRMYLRWTSFYITSKQRETENWHATQTIIWYDNYLSTVHFKIVIITIMMMIGQMMWKINSHQLFIWYVTQKYVLTTDVTKMMQLEMRRCNRKPNFNTAQYTLLTHSLHKHDHTYWHWTNCITIIGTLLVLPTTSYQPHNRSDFHKDFYSCCNI